MRQQRAQRMSTTTPVFRSGTDLPASGFAMLVDQPPSERQYSSGVAAASTHSCILRRKRSTGHCVLPALQANCDHSRPVPQRGTAEAGIPGASGWAG
jgi:hypothetical protein